MKHIIFFLMAGAAAQLAFSNPVDSLKPGQWYEVPNSHMRPVCDPLIPPHTSNQSYYCSSVITAWCGGAFDIKRDRLIVWGGGHADSPDNAVYVFDLNTLEWSRATDADTPIYGSPYTAEGTPSSRHTYNYLQYVSAIDRFCSLGGGALWGSGNEGTNHTDCLNFDTGQWESLADVPVDHGINAFSAVDPVSGHVFVHGTGSGSRLGELDPVNKVWTQALNWNPYGGFYPSGTAEVDSAHHKMVLIGGNALGVIVWDLNTPKADPTKIQTSGATGILAGMPGFAYHAKSGYLVGWNGGQDIYTLDLASRVWTKRTGSGANPGAQSQWGTYGRFRYSPKKDVFVVVNSVDQNVFIYKPGFGPATPAERRIESRAAFAAGIFPNPARIGMDVKISGAFEARETAVYDLRGRKVAGLEGGGECLWHTRGLSSGIYLLERRVDGKRFCNKLLLQP